MTISSNPHVWSVVRGEMVQSGARYLTLWHWKYISWVTGGHCFHQPRIMKVSLANWKSPKKATTKWSALARRRCPVHWPRNLVHVFLGGLSLTHSLAHSLTLLLNQVQRPKVTSNLDMTWRSPLLQLLSVGQLDNAVFGMLHPGYKLHPDIPMKV